MTAPKRNRGVASVACTRGQLAQAGLLAARAACDRSERDAFLDALGVTEALGLPLPIAPRPERYVYGAKVRPGVTS